VDLKGNKKTLTQLWLGIISGLAWSPSGNEILFTASTYGVTTSLYAVSPLGRQRLIAHLSGSSTLLDVAPDSRLLMSNGIYSMALFYLPTVDSKETDLYWHDQSSLTDISRDGKFILFTEGGDATRRGEDYVSFMRGADGSPAIRLGPGIPLEFSPEGKWAIALGSVRPPSQLVLLPTGTGEAGRSHTTGSIIRVLPGRPTASGSYSWEMSPAVASATTCRAWMAVLRERSRPRM
jgi:WD40 repeat protein